MRVGSGERRGTRDVGASGPEQAAPLAPATVGEAGLTPAFIAELTLKLLHQTCETYLVAE